jgi:ubiquinol-cytochrome c reductase cytochrome c subunit
MKRLRFAAAALAATAFGAWGAAGDAARGHGLYMKNLCYACHGTVGQGGDRGTGPRIAPNPFPWEAFLQQMRRPRDVMPRYTAEYVSDQDLADIHAYLETIKPPRKASEITLLKE